MEFDLATLRRRLAQAPPVTALAGDEGAQDDPALKPASVLVPIVARAEHLTVLFTRRTAHLRSHSGQISFPGGRAEPGDATPEATALRETQEEIGLDARRVDVITRLPQYVTRTGYCITPVVGVIAPPFDLCPDAREVEEVFEVPLSFLLDPRNHRRDSRELNGETRWFFAIPYGEYYIWGATAGMLVNFHRRVTA